MSEKIWINGKYYNKDNKNLSVDLNTIHYGTSIFEGIFSTAGTTSYVFRLAEHMDRFYYSAGILDFHLPYSKEVLSDIIKETVRQNKKGSYYIRPIAFKNSTYLDLTAKNKKLLVAILCKKFPFQVFLFQMQRKIKVMIAKGLKNNWEKPLAQAKLSGKYLISTVAKLEANKNKFDEAILLDNRNFVTEATTANVFIVKNGLIKTPSLDYTLNGVTQKSVMEIAVDLGYDVKQTDMDIEALYNADEVFLTSTARGIVSVSQIDNKTFGKNNLLASELRRCYIDILKNKNKKYNHWLTPV